ncbi:aminomethyltransferase [Salinisphaera orenii YIM 95161]|uniref:Aminomethyltransferase n=1 Tax=Salinisphaera orenii YIM 95161 TaxID=1051139 RepID=A0A423PMN4_9GAMM|nr:aminomethyltransferase family protein [Salinisphaera halophila]ROO26849.1 aminomethyltransferase [Salinisphaera halophila YIM 95161]
MIVVPNTAPASRGIRRPGEPAMPRGSERYSVDGGSLAVFRIDGGDTLRVVDVEGGQVAEVVGFVDGRGDPGLFGARAGQPAHGLQAMLAEPRRGARLRERLAPYELAVEGARAIPLFAEGSRAGSVAELTASGDGLCVVAAAGEPMPVAGGMPPTDLVVYLERADPARAERETPELPAPLAEPAQDFRVARATAQAYPVRAGQWIQIIDVAGRQCTDFQAFSTAHLERGIERCLDVTTTRSLMARSSPQPGLAAKYYDVDFQPLVEIVQDTCARHDAFALACNPAYYEEAGYFGHANCSDNFNGQLDAYGVTARRGWMSMNFFYNTEFDDAHQLMLDEPWSRPGDYVLLRALTDLVCVSSACPDDIDPANGWNPTDIHVRVYDADLEARRSIAYRPRPDAEARMTKQTGFHGQTSQLTRDYVEHEGYWLPNSYPQHGAIAEYWACREKAAIIDLSALCKFEVMGPDAEALLQYTLTRNVRRVGVGQVAYSAMCWPDGGMIDDGTLFRLADNNFRWICGIEYCGEWLREQAEAAGFEVRIKSSRAQLHNVSVQGPAARDILREIVWTRPDQADMDELGLFRFAIARLGHERGRPMIVSRTGYTGELGYEVFCHPDDADEIWQAIRAAGAPHGLTPMGMEALDMLRIEAGLIAAGHEFCDRTDPYEAGIGFAVALKKNAEDFIGRAALEARRDRPRQRLVGLTLDGEEAAAHGDGVYIGRQQIGVVTSGTRSPTLARSIALARVAAEHAGPDTRVEVGKLDGQQKRLSATVVAMPHYDPERRRLKA